MGHKMKRFFIIGSPRSGTTLLRLMLNKHSKVSVPPEAGFLAWLYDEYKDFSFTEKNATNFIATLRKTTKIEHWDIDFNLLTKFIFLEKPTSFPSLINCVYIFYSKYKLLKEVEVYGDKNNFFLNKIDLLAKLYKGVKFIHIIRDGRSVAVSYKDLNKKKIASIYAPDLPSNIEEIAKEWNHNVQKINASFDKLEAVQHITVRFEDLILEPEQSLRDICDFLEIDYDNEMLNFFQTTEKEGLEPSDFLSWKSKNMMPLQKEEVLKYKKLSKIETDIFDKMTSTILAQYNYI